MTTLALRPPAVPDASPSYPRDPRARLGGLLDPHSVSALHPADASGVTAVRGRIDGRTVVAYCADARTGGAGYRHLARAVDAAVNQRSPVVGLWHSGGARPADGAASTRGADRLLVAMTRAMGRVARISVVLGPPASAAAYGPDWADLVVTSPAAPLVGTGPVQLTVRSEGDAYVRARQVVGLLARRFLAGPGAADLLDPAAVRRPYDVRPLFDPGLVELQPASAAGVVTGLGRLAGRTVGVVAHHPPPGGGRPDPAGVETATRFVRMCDTLGVPLLVLGDATALDASAGATVPRIVLAEEVTDPADTRRRLAEAFARGPHGNIPL